MDYMRNVRLFLKGFLLILLLTACETHLSPEELKIIGFPPTIMFYDSEYSFEFGVSGGDGTYRYRYIQNPENPDPDDRDFEFNPVELAIEVTDGAKASFVLRGIPEIQEGESGDTIGPKNLSYQIEVTDGRTTTTREFEFTLSRNTVVIRDATLLASEASVNDQVFDTLLNLKKSGNTQVCNTINDRIYEETTLPNGTTVYPVLYEFRLTTLIQKRVEVFYRLESGYDENQPERSERNRGFARPGVDYLDEINSVILEPGEGRCFYHVNLLDDAIIEDTEKLEVVFFRREGAVLDISLARNTIEIRDNEPVPFYTTKQITRNEGDQIVVPITLFAAHDLPLSVNVSIDEQNTSASPDDYTLMPENGVVTIEPGDLEGAFTISLHQNQDDPEGVADDVITVVTDIDAIKENEPYQVTINEWPLNDNADLEIVASSENNESVLAMDIDNAGIISYLVEDYSNPDEIQSIVRARNREGSNFPLLQTGPILLAKQGLNVRPAGLITFSRGGVNSLAVIANVDGLYADVHRGKKDFIVAIFERTVPGKYLMRSVKQYGSEGDDIAKGAKLDNNGDLYVFGMTDGTEFEGKPGFEINNGGQDGFVYKINMSANQVIWDTPRFIGTSDDDAIVAMDVVRNDFVALASKENSDLDAFVKRIATFDGIEVEGVDDVIISSLNRDVVTSIKLDRNNSTFRVFAESNSNLPNDLQTPSLSQDAFLLTYTSEGVYRTSNIFSTLADDFASDIELLTKEDRTVVGGYTEGQFEDNQNMGGSDAFISLLDTENPSNPKTESILQFGTAGNDKLIDIEEVGERKFMVLWSEDNSAPNNALRYRISAFSPEGEKLSPDP